MMIIMYFVGLLTGLGIWFLTYCVRSEPQIKVKFDRYGRDKSVVASTKANFRPQALPPSPTKHGDWNGLMPLSRPTPPKPLHNPHK